MTLSFLTAGNLMVAPYKLERIIDLKLTRKINEHTRLCFTGILQENLGEQDIHKTSPDTLVELYQQDYGMDKKLLFKGIVSQMEIRSIQDIYYIEVEAVSLTQMLDVKLTSRSFQNPKMTYEDLINLVIRDYNGVIKDEASQGRKIEKMIMQYQETDWQFLMRLASRFNTGLVSYDLTDKPKLYFGVAECEKGIDVELEDVSYRVGKKLAGYKYASENFIPDVNEDDFVYYEVVSKQVLNIGDSVIFTGKRLFVCEATSYLENNMLKHLYRLTTQKGLSQKTFDNDKIIGLSIEGRVIGVDKDNVKAHLAIDPRQSPEEAYWIPYSTVYTAEGNSGWYCMPELDDHVRIYFPTKKEADAIAIGSVRKDSDTKGNNKLSDPDVKYFRTKSGKELMFSPSEVVITGKDNEIFIRLNDKDGIELHSTKAINIISKNNLNMESEEAKVVIKAKSGIKLTCNSSEIDLTPGSVNITGDEIKDN